QSVFTGPISEAGICCYDIAAATSPKGDFLRLVQYTCKLLILSKGLLEGLCPTKRFFLGRVLSPAAHVVVLLCGVESLNPLLELVPLNGEECTQISSEQDASEYLSTHVIECLSFSASAANMNPMTHKPSASELKGVQMQLSGADSARSSIMSSMEVFILLKNEVAGSDTEVEFTGKSRTLRVKPLRWNERILCVSAPDFPAGNVGVTVYSGGVPLNDAQLQYYNNMEEIACLLSRVTDPVDFMCQVKPQMIFLKWEIPLLPPERIKLHRAEVPSLLHFAARYGFRNVSSLLLQCPGAVRTLRTANRHGQTPVQIAKSHGHTEVHVILKEMLVTTTFNSMYFILSSFSHPKQSQQMAPPLPEPGSAGGFFLLKGSFSFPLSPKCLLRGKLQQVEEKEGEDEDLYAPLGVNGEYDTILNSAKAKAVVIANRPPAPTPRPEGTQLMDSKTPYITQVFQRKKTPGDGDLYSLPSKQARGREGSVSTTYDTFVPNQIDGLQQLIEFQQQVKAGSLTVDEALELFSDWQHVQKDLDAKQQQKLSHLRATIINNREADDSVYGKYSHSMWAKLCCHRRLFGFL
uniref:DBB domain-containing protein n=1 Tax=Pundamilia nyererei TaxID=303518 RepID=A0A3B4H5I5_9CICH